MNSLVRKLVALVVAFSFVFGQVIPAQAEIQGSDYVGSTTSHDRGLTITQVPTIDAKYGILCDADGNVLWARSSNEKAAMASITKVMTAVVTLENADLDATFTVSANAASVGESSAGLQAGNTVSVKALLQGLLIHSGNDAAVTLAEGVAGSVDAFVEMMNAKAQELSMDNTHYMNPHGLDMDGHYTSAADISILTRYAMTNKTFRKIVGTKKVTLQYGTSTHTFSSTNSLLNTWKYCIGVKTGYTGNAGYCLASAAKKDGVELYAVVLGCSDEGQRFTDSYRLLKWGFDHYRYYQLAGESDDLLDAPVSAFLNRTVPAGVEQDTGTMLLDYDGDISVDVALLDLPDGVEKGGRVGTITWRQGEKVIASAPLVAKERVGKPFVFTRVWTALIRLVGCFTGDDCVADPDLHVQTISVERANPNGETIDEGFESKIRANAAKNA